MENKFQSKKEEAIPGIAFCTTSLLLISKLNWLL